MSERLRYDIGLVRVGEYLSGLRKALGSKYANREKFVDFRSDELFGGEPWISSRYLASIELGKNWISIEKLLVLAQALEIDPVDLFKRILEIYMDKRN